MGRPKKVFRLANVKNKLKDALHILLKPFKNAEGTTDEAAEHSRLEAELGVGKSSACAAQKKKRQPKDDKHKVEVKKTPAIGRRKRRKATKSPTKMQNKQNPLSESEKSIKNLISKKSVQPKFYNKIKPKRMLRQRIVQLKDLKTKKELREMGLRSRKILKRSNKQKFKKPLTINKDRVAKELNRDQLNKIAQHIASQGLRKPASPKNLKQKAKPVVPETKKGAPKQKPIGLRNKKVLKRLQKGKEFKGLNKERVQKKNGKPQRKGKAKKN